MLLGRNWVVWQRRGKISSTNSKSTKACAVASYTFQSNPLAFQQSEYLFSLVCLSFFYPLWVSILIHFLILSFILFFFFRSIRIVSVCAVCSLLVLFFCIEAALESVASFQILVYSNNFLILACHPSRCVIVPIFLFTVRNTRNAACWWWWQYCCFCSFSNALVNVIGAGAGAGAAFVSVHDSQAIAIKYLTLRRHVMYKIRYFMISCC